MDRRERRRMGSQPAAGSSYQDPVNAQTDPRGQVTTSSVIVPASSSANPLTSAAAPDARRQALTQQLLALQQQLEHRQTALDQNVQHLQRQREQLQHQSALQQPAPVEPQRPAEPGAAWHNAQHQQHQPAAYPSFSSTTVQSAFLAQYQQPTAAAPPGRPPMHGSPSAPSGGPPSLSPASSFVPTPLGTSPAASRPSTPGTAWPFAGLPPAYPTHHAPRAASVSASGTPSGSPSVNVSPGPPPRYPLRPSDSRSRLLAATTALTSFPSLPSASSIPFVPALPAPKAPARPPPETPAARARRPFLNLIHNTTWVVARAFGFQTFNAQDPASASPARVWVPATAFVAADHLGALLVKNLMPRYAPPGGGPGEGPAADGGGGGEDGPTAQPGQEDPESALPLAFARSVWELHSHIFLSYEGEAGWCSKVGLTARLAEAEALLQGQGQGPAASDPSVLRVLLLELCLYFLLYSEAANLRHTPELLWFLFWAAVHSGAMGQLYGGRQEGEELAGGRETRIAARNALQAHISWLQRRFSHDPSSASPDDCAAAAAAMSSQLPSLLPALEAECGPAPVPSGPSPLPPQLPDLCAWGDGGRFTDRVVAPLFAVLAFEQDAMSAAGQEVAFRLGYDDVNESLCSRPNVRKALRLLGVDVKAAAAERGKAGGGKGGVANGAFDAITRLGLATPEGQEGQEASPEEQQGQQAFDVFLAAAWWADHVLVKTHRERRSWAHLLRAFYRVYSLHLVLLHAVIAQAFAPGSLRVLSSAVVTHAAVAAAERCANAWLTARVRDPLRDARQRSSWARDPAWLQQHEQEQQQGALKGKRKGKKGEQQPGEQPGAVGPVGPRRSRLSDGGAVEARAERRRHVVVEGAPLWGVFGWLEWVLAAAGLLGLYCLQHVGPPALQPMARAYWPMAAAGYAGAVAGHGLLTSRDGYTASLSAALRLPRFFAAHSARPAAGCWLERPMGVGWRAAALTWLFWLQVMAAKVAFDYFIIMRPIAAQVRLTLRRDWLRCPSPHYRILGMELPLPCIDGDWLLVALRVVPFLLVCLVDTQIFYQLALMAWGLVQGLVALNLGIAGSWEALRQEFHRAPRRWWDRCMSGTANGAARRAAAAQRAKARAAAGPLLMGPGGGGGAAAGALFEAAASSSYGGSHLDEYEYGNLYEISDPYGLRSASNSSLAFSDDRTSHGSSPTKNQGSANSSPSIRGPSKRKEPSAPAAAADAATAAGKKGSGGKKGSKKQRGIPAGRDGGGDGDGVDAAAELVSMLSGQGEEQLAMWAAFAAAWDAVVDDLRAADLISDRERANLLFTRLPAHATAIGSGSSSSSPKALPGAPSTTSLAEMSVATPTSTDAAAAAGGPVTAPRPPASRPLRPILLPAFFYAGQVRRALDTGSPSPAQQLVLGELRALLVWLGCALGLLQQQHAAALLGAQLCTATLDAEHSASRSRGYVALCRLLAVIQAAAEAGAVEGPAAADGAGEALRRRQALCAEGLVALEGVLAALEVEARAVVKAGLGKDKKDSKKGKKGKKGQQQEQRTAEAAEEGTAAPQADGEEQEAPEVDPQEAAKALLAAVGDMRKALGTGGSEVMAAALAAVAADLASPAPQPSGQPLQLPLVSRVLTTAAKMLTLSAAAAQPTGAEACRILCFFVTSLANGQLAKPQPVSAMPSWTVLTPCYTEEVLFPLEAHATAEALGLAPPAAGPGASPGHGAPASQLPDLLTETEDSVSLMAYLRSIFPKDWDNFRERLSAALGVDVRGASETDFAQGGPLSAHGLELQLWASFRGQLLARTVRGMAAYERALRVLAALEHPRPQGLSRAEYSAWLDELVSDKFSHVVAAQLYGKHRRSGQLSERWLAESTDVLLEAFPCLKVAYLDSAGLGGAKGPATQYSVLIRGRRPWAEGSGRTEELYRVRLPANKYSGRGVIIGEGKPENQNHASIFCFGEALQTIDMNQDNALAEALKMRNLLGEMRPEMETRRARRAEQQMQEAMGAAAGTSNADPAAAGPEGQQVVVAGGALPAAPELRRLLRELRASERPVALVGFREWVFSDRTGALGAFAASSEFAFSTLVQRTMAYPANVRLHYGHPDAFNKLFIMTRGGLAKASRQLHVSEDIFGGINHSLRGGRIKYREYISAGKGRDMGFDSINAFESKISAGFGEVAASRDLLRMATRLDLPRCLHLYHSLAGNYFNTWLVMGSVYLQVFALLFFALSRSAVVRDTIYYPSPPPPPPPVPAQFAVPGMPPAPPPLVREVRAYDTVRVEHVLQLGMLSLLPYVAEVALEQGLVRAVLAAVMQFVTGSFTFFIFKQQTTTTALHRSMLYGGATYVATGRSFAITSSSFIKLFTNYGRSHIALGFELAAMALAVAATNDCARCSYAGLTWGTWLAAISLLLAPCWFNPMAFQPEKVKRDMRSWAAWLRGEADRELGATWAEWNRRQLAHSRDEHEAGAQTDRWLNVAQGLALRVAPLLLLVLAAASRVTLRVDVPGLFPPLNSPYAVFLAVSVLLWALAAAGARLARRATDTSDRRRLRLFSFWLGFGVVVIPAACLVGLSKWYAGSGPADLLLIVYANTLLALAAHRTLEHTCRRSRRGRELVDGGYWLLDAATGWVVLGLLGLLSLLGFVSRVQTMLLFNVTFAKSVRRGSIVKTIGLAKAERGQGQQALVGLVLEGGPGAGGGGGGEGEGDAGSVAGSERPGGRSRSSMLSSSMFSRKKLLGGAAQQQLQSAQGQG